MLRFIVGFLCGIMFTMFFLIWVDTQERKYMTPSEQLMMEFLFKR